MKIVKVSPNSVQKAFLWIKKLLTLAKTGTWVDNIPNSKVTRPYQIFSVSFQVIMANKEGAERACKEPNPIIDGRKANVNLAILGAKPRGNSLPGKHFYRT